VNGIWKPDLLAEMVELVKKQPLYTSNSRDDIDIDISKKVSTEKENTIKSIGKEDGVNIVNILRSEDKVKKVSDLDMVDDIKENRNYVMQLSSQSKAPSDATLFMLPQRKTREEMRRNPIHQTPIQRSFKKQKPREPEYEEIEIFVEVKDSDVQEEPAEPAEQEDVKDQPSGGNDISNNIESDYIPWEQWEMIPLAYWNALLK